MTDTEKEQLQDDLLEIIDREKLHVHQYMRAAEFLAVFCSDKGLDALISLKNKECMKEGRLVPEELQKLIDKAQRRLNKVGAR